MKNWIYGLLATLIFFSLIELVFVVVDVSFSPKILRNYTIVRNEVYDRYTNHIDPFYRDRFCDFIHQKAEGHRLIASCLADYFKEKHKLDSKSLIIAIGGSTTQGDDCESGTRWTDELEKLLKVKVLNLGAGGENSDYSLNVLKKNLAEGSAPDFVIEGDWINEIFEQSYTTSSATLLFYRSYYTLYKHLRSFRFLSNITEDINKKEFTTADIRKFMLHQGTPMEEILGDKKFNFTRKANSTSLFSLALEKYSNNMKLVSDLSHQYRFKVVSLNFPYVKDYYRNFSEKLNSFFEDRWIPKIKEQQKKEAIKYNFELMDAEKCVEDFRKKLHR